jgi:hypothetical protein
MNNLRNVISTLARKFAPNAIVVQRAVTDSAEAKPAKSPPRSDYYLAGDQIALVTRAQKIDQPILKALEERVGEHAVNSTVARFDAGASFTDGRKLMALEALDAEIETRDDATQLAFAEERKREDDLAKCGGSRPYPAASSLFRWVATTAITLSVAPSLYAFFGGIFVLLKWLLAIGFGGAIALFIVAAILPDEQPLPEESEEPEEAK